MSDVGFEAKSQCYSCTQYYAPQTEWPFGVSDDTKVHDLEVEIILSKSSYYQNNTFVALTRFCLETEICMREMDGACGMYGQDERCILTLEGCLTVHLPHEILWNANLMQQGNFIDAFLARHISGTYAHHQEH